MLGCEVNPNTNRPAKRANMAEGHINQSLYLLILGAKTGSVENSNLQGTFHWHSLNCDLFVLNHGFDLTYVRRLCCIGRVKH